MAIPGDEIKKRIQEYEMEQSLFLGEDLTKYRTYALCQRISLEMADVADTVKKGVCWAMSYDWARFQVYDYRINENRFVKILQKTAALQQQLQQAGDPQQLLDNFADSEGFRRELVAEGVRPSESRSIFSVQQLALQEILSAIDCDPKTDRSGVRMLGFYGNGRGHEIALRVKEPFCFFDPNYGEFEFPTLDKLKHMITFVLNQTYIDMMTGWDIYLVDRAFPRRQQVLDGVVHIPEHVNGAPQPAYQPDAAVSGNEITPDQEKKINDTVDDILNELGFN